MEINFKNLVSAIIATQGVDITYEISGNAKVTNSTLESFDSGSVKVKTGDKNQVATFNSFREGQLSINFEGSSSDEWPAIMQSANSFLTGLREKVATMDINNLSEVNI